MPKIAVIVPTVVLVTQVYNTLREYLQDVKVSKRSGEDLSKKSLQSLLRGSDILVMTPKILGNGLERKMVHVGDFTLLLFDECHRVMKDSNEVQIMHAYLNQMKQNLAATRLPQVF